MFVLRCLPSLRGRWRRRWRRWWSGSRDCPPTPGTIFITVVWSLTNENTSFDLRLPPPPGSFCILLHYAGVYTCERTASRTAFWVNTSLECFLFVRGSVCLSGQPSQPKINDTQKKKMNKCMNAYINMK